MRIQTMIARAAALVLMCGAGLAGDKANFSGTWVLDKDKSFSNGPGLDQTMTVTHAGDAIKVEGKQVNPRGEFAINESYALDGKEAEFAPPGAGANAKGKRKANWLPDGRGILIADEITSDSPNGPATRQITRKWVLSADGRTLTIDYFIDDARGSFESKRVFVRK